MREAEKSSVWGHSERQSGVLWFGTAEGVGTISQLDKVDDVTTGGDGRGGMEKLKERPQD